ncbi:MAG: hypothetical protein QW625_03045 [Candidatus Nanoarchaeia archaeon]
MVPINVSTKELGEIISNFENYVHEITNNIDEGNRDIARQDLEKLADAYVNAIEQKMCVNPNSLEPTKELPEYLNNLPPDNPVVRLYKHIAQNPSLKTNTAIEILNLAKKLYEQDFIAP